MSLAEQIKELTGESTSQCYQCGICTGTCPLRFSMDLAPMEIIGLINRRLDKNIFSANTIWICSTCFSCQVRCPRGIKISKIFEALRQMSLRSSGDRVNLNTIQREELQKLPQVALISNQRKFSS